MASHENDGIAVAAGPVIDLQDCLRDSGQPDTALYAELHPTSLGNELLARCLVIGLARASLLR